MTTKLDYTPGRTVIPEKAFAISPSRIHSFFNKTHEWYRTEVLGETGFEGSTASILGTVCHYAADCIGNGEEPDFHEICKYLISQVVDDPTLPSDPDDYEEYLYENQTRLDIDLNIIATQMFPMIEAIRNDMTTLPSRTEELVSAAITPGYYVCGSADAVFGTMLVDYKTTSDLTPKDYIPYEYKLQLLCYAYAYKRQGVPIDRIAIKWVTRANVGRVSEKTGKPLKDYPSVVHTVIHLVTQEDWEFIEQILKLVAETVQYVREHPESAYIVFRDYRLKKPSQHPVFAKTPV